MMKIRLFVSVVALLLAANARAEFVVSLDALAQVSANDFSTHYGGGVSNVSNVTFGPTGGGNPAITNGQVKGATTYSAPDVYAVNSRSEFTGNFGVANSGGSGWRIRLNNGVTDGGAFFSDNLFAVDTMSFDEDNDTLNIAAMFVSDMAAVSYGTVRYVIRDGGDFYISESLGNLQSGSLDGNLTTNFSIEAISATWFDYDPTINPSTNGVADVGEIATPSFTNIDYVGFHMELTTAANGTIAAHNGCNFGVRQFTAQGVVSGVVDPWSKLEYWDFESDPANQAFGTNWVNSGSLDSEWSFGGPSTIATDGAGSLIISNHVGETFRKLPKAGTANAAVGSDIYAVPFSTGLYRLEMDLSAWDLPDGANSGNLELQVLSGGSALAAIRLRVSSAGNASWIQLMGKEEGTQKYNTYGQGAGSTNKTTATAVAIEFDFDSNTIGYFIDGVLKKSTNTFNEVSFDQLVFFTDANWASNNVVTIDSMGLLKFVETNVTNTPTSLWNDWLVTYPGLGADTNLTDNSDGDPGDNLYEYAMGGDPTNSAVYGIASAVNSIDGEVFEYIHVQRSDAEKRGLSYRLGTSPDLIFDLLTNANYTVVGTNTSYGVAGFDEVTNHIPSDVYNEQFIKLEIEFTP